MTMRPAEDLFTIHSEAQFDEPPVMLYAFSGFVDAGAGVRMAADHLLQSLPHRLLASFDADELLDYRARRPRMTYVVDHFASVEIPQLVLHEVTDESGQGFLLLTGPEPDYQWQRFMAAVDLVIAHYGVRLAVGLSAIPWPSPHTRPLGLTVHGSEAELLAGHVSVLGEIEVPGHVGAMLELHIGQQGLPSMGITAQVPHYLVQYEFPRAAATLLQGVAGATGLVLPVDALQPAAMQADADVAAQLSGNEEFAAVVTALEQQYDQLAAVSGGAPTAGSDLTGGRIPTGEEIAAQVEQFLSTLEDHDDPEKQTDA
ncbi:MAG: PAC2 family protein [Actinomycetota bacterium]|nr:PAC2 family protein [Actinomycetota bacterium]